MVDRRTRVLCVLSELLGQRTYSHELQHALRECGDIAEAEVVTVGDSEFAHHADRHTAHAGSTAEAEIVARRVLRERRPPPADAAIVLGWELLPAVRAWMPGAPVYVVTDMTPRLLDRAGYDGNPSRARRLLREGARAVAHHRFLREIPHTVFLPMSDWCARSLAEDYGARLAPGGPWPCPLDLDTWTPAPARPHEGLRMLFVGNDLDGKGAYRLMAFYRESLPDVGTLTIVSRDPAAARLAPMRGIAVRTGLERDALVSVYQQSDVLVMPTRRDALGHVYGEAAACGVPSVATHVGGVDTLVRDGITGYLIEPDAPDASWVALLRRLAADPALRARLGREARRLAEQLLDRRLFRERLRELLLDIRPVEAGDRATA